MADTFDYTAAINNAFGAIERLGALKLNKAREDAAIARADAAAATNRNFQATQAKLNQEASLRANADDNAAMDRRTAAAQKAADDRLAAEIARSDAATATQRQFQATQAQLDREARLRMNAEDNAAADRRTAAAQKAADDRMTAAEKKADDLVKAEERRLMAAAKTIGSVQAEFDNLQAEREQLAAQIQQELAQQTEKEIRQQFTAGLTPKQRKALAALGGDVERLIAAAPEDDALALQQQLEMARTKAEERLKLFTPPSQAKFALNQSKLLKQDSLLNDLKRRNPGYIDFVEVMQPAAPSAPAAPTADAGFGAVAEEARAALAAQAPATQAAEPEQSAVPTQPVEPAIRRVVRPVSEAGLYGAAQDVAASIPQQAADAVSAVGNASMQLGPGGKFWPPPAEAGSPEEPPGNRAIRRLLFGQPYQVQFDPARLKAAEEGRLQRAIDRNGVPVDYNVPPVIPQQPAQLPSFNPVDFARNQFGIDVADMTPDDQQGMLQLALRDGLTQADVASVIDRVKQGDPTALQVVRQYQERWNATRGARPRAGVDLGMVGLA